MKLELAETLNSGWDYLTDARVVLDSNKTLCIQRAHPTKSIVANYKKDSFRAFANAHSPLKLFEYVSEYGRLFQCHDLPYETTLYPPAIEDIRSAFSGFEWSAQHKRNITTDAQKLVAKYNEVENDQKAKDNFLIQGTLSQPLESMGDWIAARAILVRVLELIDCGTLEAGKHEKCPDFELYIPDSSGYQYFMRGRVGDAVNYDGDGKRKYIGFWIEDNVFHYDNPGNESISEMIEGLTERHFRATPNLFTNQLVFTDLLSVIWFQMYTQLKNGKLAVKRCKNCGSVMIDTPNGKKIGCCNGCTQKLKGKLY